MPAPSPEIADAIVARIRELARAHGTNVHEDAGLAELLVSLKVDDHVPVAAFTVAAELLYHLLAADQRSPAEAAS